ncbi:hypothetical protein LINPERHAP2_LOCUS15361, partial [Linum perenne]
MARPPRRHERQKMILACVSMWFGMIEQYLTLLLELAIYVGRVASESTREPPLILTLPLPRAVYRIGFLHYATKTTNQNCINMLRMNRSIFEKLCCLVNSIGGLQRRTLEL